MEFNEVSDVLVGTSRNKIVFQMDGVGRVIAFVGEEWRYSGGSIRSIVVSKLGQGEERTPVIVLIVGIHVEILLHSLVDTAPEFGRYCSRVWLTLSVWPLPSRWYLC